MNQKKQIKLIAVVGPTASGKTGLAVFLAKKFNGEIVSADSRQIYKGLDIGTGKDLAEYGSVKYHLINIIEPETPFTLFDWLERARIVIDDIFSRGKLPIIVGGTGLYVQALVEGYQLTKSQITNHKSQINSKLQIPKYQRAKLESMSLNKLRVLAKKVNSAGFKKVDRMNPIRLIRLIERAQSGEQMTKVKPDFEVLQIGINLPREELYQKIDHRVDKWFANGFYEEVEELRNKDVSIEWLNMIGLEYKILSNYIEYKKLKRKNENYKIEKLIVNCKLKIENLSSLESVKQAMKYAIHAYARRQLTWFGRFPEIKWVKSKEEILEIVKEFVV